MGQSVHPPKVFSGFAGQGLSELLGYLAEVLPDPLGQAVREFAAYREAQFTFAEKALEKRGPQKAVREGTVFGETAFELKANRGDIRNNNVKSTHPEYTLFWGLVLNLFSVNLFLFAKLWA